MKGKKINFKKERIQKDNLHFINEFKLYILLHIQSMQGVQLSILYSVFDVVTVVFIVSNTLLTFYTINILQKCI